MSEPFDLLRQGLRAALLLRPDHRAARPLGPPGLLLAALLYLGASLAIDFFTVPRPRQFVLWALGPQALPILLALLGGGVAAAVLGRPQLWLRLAAIALVASIAALLAWAAGGGELVGQWLPGAVDPWLLPVGYALLVAARLMHWARGRPGQARPAGAALSSAALVTVAMVLVAGNAWWWPLPPDPADSGPPGRDYSAETLLYAQPPLIAAAVAALAPQRPGVVDLYAIGFGGDGNEAVFRNEIEHFEQLFGRRFDAAGRVIGLVNHPGTLDDRPLATLSNLRQAVAGIAAVMDRDEDILLLFLTSHGSREHELYVALHDLPLDQVTAADLQALLDEADIRWRVLIVSACYSGGFIEPLAGPETLIMTAARHDRPSFGCGVQSEITWFGEALLAEALNETTDLVDAFERARRAIRARERAAEEKPSRPQIAVGERIEAQLQRWQSTLPAAPVAVPFIPAVAVPAEVEGDGGGDPEGSGDGVVAEQSTGDGTEEASDRDTGPGPGTESVSPPDRD